MTDSHTRRIGSRGPVTCASGYCATARFHFHFTPTYGSWMNLVERWFSALTTKKLQRSAHRSVQALAQDIRDWVETWNDNPRPFAGDCRSLNK
jgi:transposase